MIRRYYKKWVENWDQRLAMVSNDRIVREFEWGLEWAQHWPGVRELTHGEHPADYLREVNEDIVSHSDQFYQHTTPTDFFLGGSLLQFTSNVRTPYAENDLVRASFFPAPSRKAVVVLPHWNSKEGAHVGLCRMIQKLGINALRLSLPYHDRRMPPELGRADYSVSSNVCRTIDATRQAVLDVRCCFDWLQQQGMEQLGIVGTSLGSCYAFLVSAHDERIRVNAFNHCSTYFADVVWTGLATRHIKQGIATDVDLERLRSAWLAVSPYPYVERFSRQNKKSLFIYARYDTSFLPEYSQEIIAHIRKHEANHRVAILPCGHYTTGETPYKFIDGFHIGRFLRSAFR